MREAGCHGHVGAAHLGEAPLAYLRRGDLHDGIAIVGRLLLGNLHANLPAGWRKIIIAPPIKHLTANDCNANQ